MAVSQTVVLPKMLYPYLNQSYTNNIIQKNVLVAEKLDTMDLVGVCWMIGVYFRNIYYETVDFEYGFISADIVKIIQSVPGEFDRKILMYNLRLEDLKNITPPNSREIIEKTVLNNPSLMYCYSDMLLGLQVLIYNEIEFNLYKYVYIVIFLVICIVVVIIIKYRENSDSKKNYLKKIVSSVVGVPQANLMSSILSKQKKD